MQDLIEYLQSQEFTTFSPKKTRNPRLKKWKDTKKLRSLYLRKKSFINGADNQRGLTQNGVLWYHDNKGRIHYRVAVHKRSKAEKGNGLIEGKDDEFAWNKSRSGKSSRAFQRSWQYLMSETFKELEEDRFNG